jgi:hypothetical protein
LAAILWSLGGEWILLEINPQNMIVEEMRRTAPAGRETAGSHRNREYIDSIAIKQIL